MIDLQAPDAVVMIRPHHVTSNPETRVDNAFQTLGTHSARATSAAALQEADEAVRKLRGTGVRVHIFDDTGDRNTPDSVFPNNWFSTHTGGHVAINPMFAESRDGRVLALSSRALAALTANQITLIEKSATLLPLSVPAIETAGGSVRCMLAGIHLTRRPERTPHDHAF